MAWDINEKRKKLRRPFHHIMYSSLNRCNSLGRMIFMCAYLPAACSRSVANPALPPSKKKREVSEREG
ncbi:CEI_1a_G0014020.mRNA.1.CDS.1 [Saccharomyces cerevisiae]|nr:AMH_1a_G0014040.mRNA.1.CDS.1 [Saccharomyces cerevisiae]CAI4416033.1 CEI_1a_G0014020.mRNA.1.CDS.1 [Saccharomyces cerevisiae]CAI6615912.1 AMH_1a_G0014040.mRNA.1.CDS.1 [Saccharomyces cerevisiae]CAI7251826.1 CEI_1a_G0014020.mRNA.1.CDS.1 [Saccharomyces cerevisiae]